MEFLLLGDCLQNSGILFYHLWNHYRRLDGLYLWTVVYFVIEHSVISTSCTIMVTVNYSNTLFLWCTQVRNSVYKNWSPKRQLGSSEIFQSFNCNAVAKNKKNINWWIGLSQEQKKPVRFPLSLKPMGHKICINKWLVYIKGSHNWL